MKSKEILPEEERCEAGCKMFYGGEVRHHEDCVFYPESFTRMYDEQKAKLKSAEEEIEEWKGMYEIISKRERGNNDQLLNEFGNYLVKRKANSGKVMSSNFIAEIVEEFLKKKEGN